MNAYGGELGYISNKKNAVVISGHPNLGGNFNNNNRNEVGSMDSQNNNNNEYTYKDMSLMNDRG